MRHKLTNIRKTIPFLFEFSVFLSGTGAPAEQQPERVKELETLALRLQKEQGMMDYFELEKIDPDRTRFGGPWLLSAGVAGFDKARRARARR